MGRRRPNDDSPGGANWMDTYGDLVTLLLTFFVLLYSFSSLDAAKWQAFVSSFSGSPQPVAATNNGKIQSINPLANLIPRGFPAQTLHDPVDEAEAITETLAPQVTEPPKPAETSASATIATTQATTRETTHTTTAKPKPTEDPQIKRLQDDLKAYLQGSAIGGSLSVEIKNSQLLIRLVASVIFESGSDQLRPEAASVLDGAAQIIRNYAPQVQSLRTEGHTDSVTPPEGGIESKWELAARRSAKVLQRIMAGSGLDQDIAYTVGYGSARPIASDETVQGQDLNNRVDVILVS